MDRFITIKKINRTDNVEPRRTLTQSNENESESENSTQTANEKSDFYSSDETEDTKNSNISANKTKIYHRKFKDDWKNKFSWVEKDSSGKPYCKTCCKIINGGFTHLERHQSTNFHLRNFKKAEKTPVITSFLTDEKREKHKNLVKSAELKLTMFLHEHNLPYSLMDHLPQLIRSVCPDSQIAKDIHCGRSKATSITYDCLAKEQLFIITEKLNHIKFSIIIDETTDISVNKSLAIVARFHDEDKFKDHFLGLISVKSSSAEELFKAICKYLTDLKIPINNLIGLAADNCSVMMGNISGVATRFKEILPNIFILGCVCHSSHLCSSAAAKKLPRCLEDFIRSLYNYFAYSSKRLGKLKEFQMFIQLKPHKLLHPSQTRWLSLQQAIDRVLENWDALVLFFTSECFEDNLHSNQTILESLKNPIYKIYFTFLSYVLVIVNRLNIEFQSESPKLPLLLTRVRNLFKTVLKNYLKKNYLDSHSLSKIDVSNPRNFIALENIYFGAKTEILLLNKNIDRKEIDSFEVRALDFYVELSKQIKMRINLDDPVLNYISQFEPKKALNGDIPSIATDSLKLFPHLVNDIEKLNTEWRLLSDLEDLKQYKDLNVEEFWNKMFLLKNELNEEMFPNLNLLVKSLLSLPHSSAAAERVFSQLNLLKTKLRNRLLISNCDSILHTKQLLNKNTCFTWAPNNSLLKRKPSY